MTTRRLFLMALGGSAVSTSWTALPQERAKVWRIGLFHVGLDHIPPALDGLKEGLRALGYHEGKNVVYDFHNLADQRAARATAQKFVREKVDLIVAFENVPIQVAKEATNRIPIVMLHMSDPVADGFVKSLSHPGGNITGFTGSGDMQAKELELFKELVPGLKRPLLLYSSNDPASLRWLAHAREAGRLLGLQFVEHQATSQADVERIFANLKPGEVDGIFMCSPHLRMDFHSLVLELATQYRLPLVGYRAGWVERGALFSYSVDVGKVGRVGMARHIDKILRGAKPAEIPVEQISEFDFVVNRRVAREYGFKIPDSILMRANRVID
jgi:putative tryptophan/tyrosine transport system substrate-binding protein